MGGSCQVVPPVGSVLYVSLKLLKARPNCLRLFRHWVRAAASRTFCTAGSNSPIRMAMMAITTSSSISVKARDLPRERKRRRIIRPPQQKKSKGESFLREIRSGERAGADLLPVVPPCGQSRDLFIPDWSSVQAVSPNLREE